MGSHMWVSALTMLEYLLLLLSSLGCLLCLPPPPSWLLQGPEGGEVHYFYERHFLVPPLPGTWGPVRAGFSVKHGDHFSDRILGLTRGNHNVEKSFSYNPGFVPVYGRHGYDISYGLA